MNDSDKIRKKLCSDTQLLILKIIIEDKLSVKACSKEFKVSKSSVYRVLQEYHRHGISNLTNEISKWSACHNLV